MDYKAYALMTILLAAIATTGSLGAAYAQTNSVTVQTDKDQYKTGETITVTGKVGTVKAGQPILVQVFNPSGAAYRFDQATVNQDGTFSYPFVVGGKLGTTGEYRVVATYDRASQETTFSFESSEEQQQTPGMSTFTLEAGNKTYPVKYAITNGQLNGLSVDAESFTLIANITSTGDGTLTLELPRNVMDSKQGDQDSEFAVFADDIPADASETATTDSARTIAIDFENGTEKIEIIGTSIVPEFGAIAVMTLALAITTLAIVGSRFQGRFSFMPRQ